MEQSETSDSRPHTNLPQDNTNDNENVLSETSAKRPYINLFQGNTTDDENVIQRQPTTPQLPSQLTHNTTESVQDILTNPPNTIMCFKCLPEILQNILITFSIKKTLLHYL